MLIGSAAVLVILAVFFWRVGHHTAGESPSGGIDSQFVLSCPGVTPEEVRAEVRMRIDEMAAGGGYIAAPSHSVPSDPALIDAMKDEIASYGRRCYARPT